MVKLDILFGIIANSQVAANLVYVQDAKVEVYPILKFTDFVL